MAASILAIATAVPGHRLDAHDALARLRGFYPQLDRLEQADAGLGTRYTCEPVDDVLVPRGLTDLGRSYLRHAKGLALESACRALADAGLSGRDVDLIITVSCTGYLVPSLDVHMARELGLRPDVLRLPITELGCSAGAAALAAAQRHLAAFPEDHVLVVAVEIPSLSFQRGDRSLDHLTACLVFGDGAGAAVVGSPDPSRDLLVIARSASHLIPASEDMLGFDLRDGGFHVVLDRRLPRILRRHLKAVVDGFMSEPAFYAVHAAGPRIFAEVESALAIKAGALDLSRQVFAEVGNTSSAAIFFVLEKLLSQDDLRGAGLGLGLGPGVTLELMELRAPTKRSQKPSRARSVPTSALA
jgi:predicted naringenin-chalcone synthase